MLAMPPARIAADPLAPHLGRADLVRRVHEHEAAHQIGPRARQRLGDHAADRQAADDHLLRPPGVEQPGQIVGQLGHRIGAGRGIGEPVAALVVADGAEPAAELGQQRLPDPQIRPQRIYQDQQRCVARAGRLMVDHDVAEAIERHVLRLPSLPAESTGSCSLADRAAWRK